MNPDKLNDVYNIICGKIFETYDIFKRFFGEEHTDLQGVIPKKDVIDILKYCDIRTPSDIPDRVFVNYPVHIMIHYPEVTISNEQDNSAVLRDLYVKILVNYDGTFSYFYINRATYTEKEFLSDYMHSHCAGIPYEDFQEFKSPCLGTGPITHTLGRLISHYDTDLIKLFCIQLDLYIKTESIIGGPYRRIERIGTSVNSTKILYTMKTNFKGELTAYEKDLFKSFLKYLFKKNVIKYQYTNNAFYIGMKDIKYILTISKIFIEWYNNIARFDPVMQPTAHDLLVKTNTDGYYFYTLNNYMSENINNCIGERVCTFKGKAVTINIIDREFTDNSIFILRRSYLNYITTKILLVLNYKYGRQEDNLDEEIRYI